MIPWVFLESAQVPGNGGELGLYRRGEEFSIRVGNRELMNSRVHGSEEALAEMAFAQIAGRIAPRILIGGLGMGYTLAAALRGLGIEGSVTVAELVPAVVAWNRGEALRAFAKRFDLEEIRSLAAVINQAERYGTSVVQALTVYAETMRVRRQQRAEELAHRAVIKVIFPTLLCILPSLFVVILGPAAMRIYDHLIGPGGVMHR